MRDGAGGCLLPQLASPRLGGAAPGLTLTPERLLVAQAEAFACCDGTGLYLDRETRDLARTCVLSRRLKETRRVAAECQRLMGHEGGDILAQAMRGALAGPWLERLGLIALKRAARGLAWSVGREQLPGRAASQAPSGALGAPDGADCGDRATGLGHGARGPSSRAGGGAGDRAGGHGYGSLSPSSAGVPGGRATGNDHGSRGPSSRADGGAGERAGGHGCGSLSPSSAGVPGDRAAAPRRSEGGRSIPPPAIWTLAVAAAWRFGLKPHVVIFGKTEPHALLPVPGAAPDVLLVGAVDSLWDGHAADALDALAGYAYATVRPLFLELVARREPPPALAPPTSTRAAFDRRLGRVKARSPLVYLPPAAVAKLMDVTDGLSELAAQARRERQALSGRAPASGPVRLPWD